MTGLIRLGGRWLLQGNRSCCMQVKSIALIVWSVLRTYSTGHPCPTSGCLVGATQATKSGAACQYASKQATLNTKRNFGELNTY